MGREGSPVSDFDLKIDDFVNRTGLKVRTVVKKLVFDVFREVLRKSPVDTGRFRANWRVSAGAPDLTTTSVAEKGTGSAVGLTLSDASKKVNEVFAGGATPNEVWITNNVPYAEFLERGGSSQAPSGVLRVSLDRVVAEFRNGL